MYGLIRNYILMKNKYFYSIDINVSGLVVHIWWYIITATTTDTNIENNRWHIPNQNKALLSELISCTLMISRTPYLLWENNNNICSSSILTLLRIPQVFTCILNPLFVLAILPVRELMSYFVQQNKMDYGEKCNMFWYNYIVWAKFIYKNVKYFRIQFISCFTSILAMDCLEFIPRKYSEFMCIIYCFSL